MSEHMLPSGLFAFMRMYPDQAPFGLQQWIDDWVSVMISRSDNEYDFRRFGLFNGIDQWTIPRFGDESSNGGSGWNEPGNVAGVPGVMIAMASQASDQSLRPRATEIATAHWDAILGRNPTGWHSAFRGPEDYPGVERGWQRDFNPNAGARLHGVRGTINSCATHEHYPNQLNSSFLRHPEGWTAFNAAYSVSLAMQCWERTSLELVENDDSIDVILHAPVLQPTATVDLRSEIGDVEELTLNATDSLQTVFIGNIPRNLDLKFQPGDGVLSIGSGNFTVQYGGGFLSRQIIAGNLPSQVDVTHGMIVNGTVSSTSFSDDDYLRIFPELPDTENQAQVSVEASFTIPDQTVETITVLLESAANTPGIGLELEIFDHQSQEFETLSDSVIEESVNDDELHVELATDDIESFISTENEVRILASWRNTGPVFLYPWQIQIDRIGILTGN